MQPKDKINKHAWNLIEGAVDNLQTDIMSAMNSGQLKIEKSALPFLLTLVKSSVESGYHKGSKVFDRSVQTVLDEATSSVMSSSKKKS